MPRKSAKKAKAPKVKEPVPPSGVTGTLGGQGAPNAGLTTATATPVGHTSPASSITEEKKERALEEKHPMATGGTRKGPRSTAKKRNRGTGPSGDDFDPHMGKPRGGFSAAEQRRAQQMQPIGLRPQPKAAPVGQGLAALVFEGLDMLRRHTGHAESPDWLEWKNRMASHGVEAAKPPKAGRLKTETPKAAKKTAKKSGGKGAAKRGPRGQFVKQK